MTVCTSWPQACILPFTFEANARPVCSWIGSASMSARMPMVRPGFAPCRVATTPVLPTPVRHCSPRPVRKAETFFAVSCSSKASSGCWWICLRKATSSGVTRATMSSIFMRALSPEPRHPLLEADRGGEEAAVGAVDEVQVAAGVVEHQAGHVRAVGDVQPVGELALRVALLEPRGQLGALRLGAGQHLAVHVVELAHVAVAHQRGLVQGPVGVLGADAEPHQEPAED